MRLDEMVSPGNRLVQCLQTLLHHNWCQQMLSWQVFTTQPNTHIWAVPSLLPQFSWLQLLPTRSDARMQQWMFQPVYVLHDLDIQAALKTSVVYVLDLNAIADLSSDFSFTYSMEEWWCQCVFQKIVASKWWFSESGVRNEMECVT